ncbi:hypothetical protein FXO37_35713 [Capsicum annuum]|nr:hypothetical protein FXO37_35713 [Capsicum annuum]
MWYNKCKSNGLKVAVASSADRIKVDANLAAPEMLLERGLVLGQCHLIGQARGRLHGVCDENLLAPLIRWHPELRYADKNASHFICYRLLFVESGYTCTFILNYLCCRQEGLSHEVLQWYICRMESWFTAYVDTISLKTLDQASVFSFADTSSSLLGD